MRRLNLLNDDFVLGEAMELLRRTPLILRAWLSGLPEGWTTATEGPETWSPFDVLGHLIHGERTDWIPRAKHILSEESHTPFEPFDRFAQLRESEGKSLEKLLDDFETVRLKNIEELSAFQLGAVELEMRGIHPAFGTVTLRQLLATWVAHDLSHLSQISRVMAKRYKEEVGPWKKYLRVLQP